MGALDGLTVAAFESRRAAEFAKLLRRHGAHYRSAPALREIPLEQNPQALRLIDELEAGAVHAVLLLTGVGARALVDAVAPRCPKERLVELLGGVTLIARGPKPVAALRELGLTADVRAPEPNTWREILSELDRSLPVRGLRIAVQEYGRTNEELIAGLEERGAIPVSIPVYRWTLPENLEPLRSTLDEICAGRVDVVVFTTAVQLDHVLEVAGERAETVLRALRNVIVASIGPTATEALRARGIAPAIEANPPKLGYLATAIAEHAPAALAARRQAVPNPIRQG